MKTSRGQSDNIESGKNSLKRNVKYMTNVMREKLAITGIVILLALFALIFKLYTIQRDNSKSYNQKVLSQLKYDSRDIAARRGDILDRNGTFIATSTKVYNLIIDPSRINNNQENYLEPTVSLLCEVFGYDQATVKQVLADKSESQYLRYEKQISKEQKDLFESRQKQINSDYNSAGDTHQVYGVWFEDAYVRTYPFNSMGCNVIGFTGEEGALGTGGIEQYYNSELVGTMGREYGYLNDESNLERVTKAPANGNTVVSTIDVNIQSTVEKYIAQWQNRVGSNVTACIVMDPNTGEILAMASSNSFDLNKPRDLSKYYTDDEIAAMNADEQTQIFASMWKNYCVSDTYEPGSTSKIFTVAAGMETGSITGNESYNCTGAVEIGPDTIHCSNRYGHGTLNITQGLMESCNVVMMRIAQATGKVNYYKFQDLFGFGSKTGIDLPGEADTSTLVHSAENSVLADLATNSFGQNYNCTMVQLAAAFASVINGGSYYEPHIVKQIQNENGSVTKEIKPELVRETVSESTSSFIRNALYKTVEKGTGAAAKVEGYTVGGKTGTAEKYPRGNKKYLVSFCGFAPVDNPQVLCYVIVDQPKVADQAHSSFASEIFQSIMTDILPYLDIFPSGKNAATPSSAFSDGLMQRTTGDTETANEQESAATDEENDSKGSKKNTDKTDESTEEFTYATDEVIGPDSGADIPGAPPGEKTNNINTPETKAEPASEPAAKTTVKSTG